MKLSLSWIFDHINGIKLSSVNIDDLVSKFNDTTAEVEHWYPVTLDLEFLALAQVTKIESDKVILFCAEWNKEIVLPYRKDLMIDRFFLVKKENKDFRYAHCTDVCSQKDALLPALSCTTEDQKGAWKQTIIERDYIMVLDNKSISHRPDLWGHRGIAREIAALLNASLVPEEQLVIPCIVKNYENVSTTNQKNPIGLEIKTPLCKRLAGLYFPEITWQPSLLPIALRLALVDAKPIDALVDFTNYVMQDVGHPMHAFDAATLRTGSLIAQNAKSGSRLKLLDGQDIVLDNTDCVLTDGKKPLSLAGIMGGAESGISPQTTSVLAEAAHFEPGAIRKSSLRHKIRTESSARFEKGLDQNQNTFALMRFLFLLDKYGIVFKTEKEIASLGALSPERVITITHDFIVKKIGNSVKEQTVVDILKKLGFGVQQSDSRDGLLYSITVPTFRHNVTIKEDIVEEIVRFVGLSSLAPIIPVRQIKPVDNHKVLMLRSIKEHCAFGMRMHELVSYNLFDEDWLRQIQWQPDNAVQLANPVSDIWQKLLTTLIPPMLKALQINSHDHKACAFFEWGKTWHPQKDSIKEKTMLALSWYDPKGHINFYDCKNDINSLFNLLGLLVQWEKPSCSVESWYHPYQMAQLIHEDKCVGFAGMINPHFLSSLMIGNGFIAQIDGDFLLSSIKSDTQFTSLPKYQKVYLDISLLVPTAVPVTDLEYAIAMADARIREVYLIDFYENLEWKDKRSVTLRYVILDDYKTLVKDEIDTIAAQVLNAVQTKGATVR